MKVMESLGYEKREVNGLNLTQDNGEVYFYDNDELVGKVDIFIEEDVFDYKVLKIRNIDSYKKGFGRKIMNYLNDFCKTQYIKEMFGACATGSEGFYEKIGADLVDGSRYYGMDKKGQLYFSMQIN